MNPGLFRRRLVELGEAFADFCSPEPHDRVLASLVVGPATEYLGTDYALPQEIVLPGEGVLYDVAEQILTLLRAPKRRAGQNLIQGLIDSSGISYPGLVRILLSENRVSLGTHI